MCLWVFWTVIVEEAPVRYEPAQCEAGDSHYDPDPIHHVDAFQSTVYVPEVVTVIVKVVASRAVTAIVP